jgi:hypothetical protein
VEVRSEVRKAGIGFPCFVNFTLTTPQRRLCSSKQN